MRTIINNQKKERDILLSRPYLYYLVLFRGDTLIYACSPDSLTEINEILAETGYLRR